MKDDIGKADRELVKRASRELLVAVRARLAELNRFWEKEQTKAEVETLILDHVYAHFPEPPFSAQEKKLIAANVYAHVWQQAMSDSFGVGFDGRTELLHRPESGRFRPRGLLRHPRHPARTL